MAYDSTHGVARRALVALVLLAGCQPADTKRTAEPGRVAPALVEVRTMVDDSDIDSERNGFRYAGRWEHVSDREDSRALGTSSRSFHRGDGVTLAFVGTQVRLYAVSGAKGGYGALTLDRRKLPDRADFYAPQSLPGALVFTSQALAPGHHTLSLRVTGEHDRRSAGTYVNIDYAAVSGNEEELAP